ncbi:MAG: chemotaxis protein CheW [Holosporales bacterium]|jgi:purine-binding chemotaxis protein CheW|nr:chemotaxis protein CheW [Holosporales bacterium]
MTFRISELLMAIDVVFMRDVLGKREYNEVPLAAYGISGIVNLRGNIVTVLDIENIINANNQPHNRLYNIVFDLNSELFSLAVDEIGEFMDIKTNEIEPVPNSIDPSVTAVSSGVIYAKEKIFLLLDFEKSIKLLLQNIETGE